MAEANATPAGGSDRQTAEESETKENLAASRAARGDVAGDDGDGVEREVSTSGCSCGSHAAGSWAEDALRTGNATTRLPKEDDDLGLTEARDGKATSEIEDGKLPKKDDDMGLTEARGGKAIGEIGTAMETPDREWTAETSSSSAGGRMARKQANRHGHQESRGRQAPSTTS